MDYSHLSDDELMAAAGIKPQRDLSSASDEELMLSAGLSGSPKNTSYNSLQSSIQGAAQGATAFQRGHCFHGG